MTDILIPENTELDSVNIAEEVQDTFDYIENAITESTKKAYRVQWEQFSAWCTVRKLEFLPAKPETVAIFISWMAKHNKKVSTIARMLASISKAHSTAKLETPTKYSCVNAALKGIKREIGVEQDRVDPLETEIMLKIANSFDTSLEGIRNRALIMIGRQGAFRRSELVGVLRSNTKMLEEGVRIKVQKSKTDQEGIGLIKAIPKAKDKNNCPVAALTDWLLLAPDSKYLFCHVGTPTGIAKEGDSLSDKFVARLIAGKALELGIDGWFAGHSLRAGFVTSAVKLGKDDRKIMRMTGHKSHAMIDRYVRIATEFTDNASDGML